VTVEASSPALIERTRSTVTDDRGQYQIVDLPPGTYGVTFALPGFATVQRQALELSGGGVTTVNAEMRVGGVQETITVSGAAPVVDMQTSTKRETVLSNDFVRSLPAARGYGNYLAGVPGISGTGLGASATPSNNFFTSRGGRNSEGNIQLDGMNVGSSVGGGGVSGYQYDMSNAAEVQVTIAGGLAEVDRGGPAFNMIPKTGGNSFAGSYFGSIAGKWAQGSNIDDTLRSYGFTDQAALIRNWDTNFAFSGPILRDRIWFYSNVRTVGTYQDSPNLYGNANVANPNNWTYVADPNVKVRNATSKKIGATRLTWQASQRNKFGFYIDYTKNCSGSSVSQDGGQCRAPGDGWTASGPGIGPGVPTTSPESFTAVGWVVGTFFNVGLNPGHLLHLEAHNGICDRSVKYKATYEWEGTPVTLETKEYDCFNLPAEQTFPAINACPIEPPDGEDPADRIPPGKGGKYGHEDDLPSRGNNPLF
jgi:hypothetical protein